LALGLLGVRLERLGPPVLLRRGISGSIRRKAPAAFRTPPSLPPFPSFLSSLQSRGRRPTPRCGKDIGEPCAGGMAKRGHLTRRPWRLPFPSLTHRVLPSPTSRPLLPPPLTPFLLHPASSLAVFLRSTTRVRAKAHCPPRRRRQRLIFPSSLLCFSRACGRCRGSFGPSCKNPLETHTGMS